MSCDCVSPAAFTRAVRRARKGHLCAECRTPIHVGESYLYLSGIWDGTPDSFHLHIECDEWRHGLEKAIAAIPNSYLCDCISIGGLKEALAEFCSEILNYDAKTGARVWGLPQPPVRLPWGITVT